MNDHFLYKLCRLTNQINNGTGCVSDIYILVSVHMEQLGYYW